MPSNMAIPIPFRNDSGLTVTPYGCVMVTGVATQTDGDHIITIDQPDGTEGATYFLNGPIEVLDGQYGDCFSAFESILWADYNTANTPAAGEEWGPASGSWELAEGNSGFRIIGGASNGIVLVTSVGGGVCPSQNEIQRVSLIGVPTGGTFDLVLTLNGTPEDIQVNYNSSAASAQTALEGHSEATTGDFTCSGGALPNQPIDVEFTGNFAATSITLMGYDTTSLTGGSGVGCIIQRIQTGR